MVLAYHQIDYHVKSERSDCLLILIWSLPVPHNGRYLFGSVVLLCGFKVWTGSELTSSE